MLSNGWDYESPASPRPTLDKIPTFSRKDPKGGSSPEN